MSNEKIDSLYASMYEEQRFLIHYIDGMLKLGYTYKELEYLYGKKSVLTPHLENLTYEILTDLLRDCSNRRLQKIVCGEEFLWKVVTYPEYYKLVIDLKDLVEHNVTDALVFIDIRDNYGYFKHKNNCNEGLNYINGKWQKLK